MIKQFGGKVTQDHKSHYSKSPHWKDDKFQNLEETSMEFSFQALPKLLYKQFFEKKGKEPEQPIPVIPFDQKAFSSPSEKAKFIWYGHSVVLSRMNNKTILIDPMLGANASPIAPFATKRFSENTLHLIDNFPEIDLLIMTHDHYDHLDLGSLEKLVPKVKKYFVAMGVGRHLEKWGVDESLITEFDWWDQHSFENLNITFTPTRHFSGRGLTDRAKSLWGGWIFKTSDENIWFSGDGGYGNHFKEIGKRLGPFDFGFMECGQYNKNWHQIHMYPEESIQAAVDAGVKQVMPVHWGGFALAQHSWKEPVDHFAKAAKEINLGLSTPQIGELFTIADPKTLPWWEQYK